MQLFGHDTKCWTNSNFDLEMALAGKVQGSRNYLGSFVSEPWMYVPNVVVNHPIVVCQSGPRWWTDLL